MGNPQITFFKVVYKQHTNFSIESINIPFEGLNSISELNVSPVSLRVKIPRVGDLLSNLFVRVEIPDIISSQYKRFQWVENLGEVMIQTATLHIGGTKIETLTSEWLHLYHKLNLSDSKRELYDNLIGNTRDCNRVNIPPSTLTDLTYSSFFGYPNPPESDILNDYLRQLAKVDSISSGAKDVNTMEALREDLPKSVSSFYNMLSQLNNLQAANWPYYDPEMTIKNPQVLRPSIKGRSLYIPLPFSFSKNIGLALPLIALQYHDIEVEIEFSPLIHLFTVTDWSTELHTYNRVRPNPLKPDERLSYFVYGARPINLPEDPNANTQNIETVGEEEQHEGPSPSAKAWESRIQNAYNDLTHTMQVSLEASFVFLEDDERKLFANMPHEYLIEQVSIREDSGFHGNLSQLEMSLYNPAKEMIWVLKRDDAEERNIWFNYTNTLTPSIYNLGDSAIVEKAKIQFNGIDRFDYKDSTYLSFLQPYLHHTNSQPGINLFSFSLEPEKFQPSGAVNMSMINKVTLDFQTTVPPIDPEIYDVLQHDNTSGGKTQKIINSYGIQLDKYNSVSREHLSYVKDKQIFEYTYNLRIYIVSYNILRIVGGMAGLAYNS
jgi:hypothetical protein